MNNIVHAQAMFFPNFTVL